MSIDDLPGGCPGGTELGWGGRYLSIAAHFGYDGDNVPKQWLCATARTDEPEARYTCSALHKRSMT